MKRMSVRKIRMESRMPRQLLVATLGAVAAASALACSADVGSAEAVQNEESPIIGGSTITVATRRALGLVDVNGGCSGSLITPHWALTATHCVDRVTPSNNVVRMPRTDGGTDSRVAIAVSQVGQSDISLLQLQNPSAGMTWPDTPTRTMVSSFTNLVGQNVICYGRGATAYASPSGTTGGGEWRKLVRTVASTDGINLIVNADNGNNILAPGDSGGACFFGGQIAGVVSHINQADCVDPTTNDTCKATLTKINSVALSDTSRFENYINNAPLHPATATFRPLTLEAGWAPAFNYNLPGLAASDGAVYLRGAMTTGGVNGFAFTLPAGFRPSTDVYVPVNLCGGFKGRLYIQPNGITTVQTEANGWINAQCLTALDGVSFLTSSAFTQLTLQNGWGHAPFNTRQAAVRLSSGIVQFRGAIAGGTNGVVFNLPAQFRPPTKVYVPVDMCNSTKGRLNIAVNGDVTVQAETDFGNAQCFTSLEGASYALSAVGWSSTPPLNGWTSSPFGTREPAAANIGGIVRLQGAVATTGTETHAFTLPPQMRPPGLVILPVDMCGSKRGSLQIQSDGRVFLNSSFPFSQVRCFASLEGVTFGL